MSLPDRMSLRAEWNSYWEEQQKKTHQFFYSLIASVYRRFIIRPFLTHFIRSSFLPNERLLHTGCGGGTVDEDIVEYADITAVDFSITAVNRYTQRFTGKSSCLVADVSELAIKDSSFDGVYNLGLMEHFGRNDHKKILGEFKRILKPTGKLLLIWPPRFGLSVVFLKVVHWLLNDIFKKEIRLHPPEPSLIRSKAWLSALLEENGFEIVTYYFGPRDLFTQCAIVAKIAI